MNDEWGPTSRLKKILCILVSLGVIGVIGFRAYLYWEIKEVIGMWECRGEEYIDEGDNNAKKQEKFNLELKQNLIPNLYLNYTLIDFNM